MSNQTNTHTAVAEPKQDVKTRPRKQPPYHVILLDDNDHTYHYVIHLARQVFGYPTSRGFALAKEVDTTGRAIMLTTTLEHAELKRDQIRALGPDPLIERCKGPMSVRLEPAE